MSDGVKVGQRGDVNWKQASSFTGAKCGLIYIELNNTNHFLDPPSQRNKFPGVIKVVGWFSGAKLRSEVERNLEENPEMSHRKDSFPFYSKSSTGVLSVAGAVTKRRCSISFVMGLWIFHCDQHFSLIQE